MEILYLDISRFVNETVPVYVMTKEVLSHERINEYSVNAWTIDKELNTLIYYRKYPAKDILNIIESKEFKKNFRKYELRFKKI